MSYALQLKVKSARHPPATAKPPMSAGPTSTQFLMALQLVLWTHSPRSRCNPQIEQTDVCIPPELPRHGVTGDKSGRRAPHRPRARPAVRASRRPQALPRPPRLAPLRATARRPATPASRRVPRRARRATESNLREPAFHVAFPSKHDSGLSADVWVALGHVNRLGVDGLLHCRTSSVRA